MSEAVKVGVGALKQGAKSGGSGVAKGAAGPAADGNAQMNGLVGRMLVRAIWTQEWILANPEATIEARKAAWKDTREATMNKNLKTYHRALGVLTRSGVVISLSGDLADDETE